MVEFESLVLMIKKSLEKKWRKKVVGGGRGLGGYLLHRFDRAVIPQKTFVEQCFPQSHNSIFNQTGYSKEID